VLCVHLVYLAQGRAYQLLLITTEQKWYLLCSATAKQRAALADWAKKMTIARGFKGEGTCRLQLRKQNANMGTLLYELHPCFSVIAEVPMPTM
jgi:hypothetical protein